MFWHQQARNLLINLNLNFEKQDLRKDYADAQASLSSCISPVLCNILAYGAAYLDLCTHI